MALDGPRAISNLPDFLAGGGKAGALIRNLDWSSSLGPSEEWPQTLKTLVGVMLGSSQPMFVAWGPDRVLLYNDGYAEILASKHPSALGCDFLEVWSEITDDLRPIVEQAYEGVPVQMDDIKLIMHRRGYPEETHFSFSYTPVRDESGAVCGFFCPCVEITEQVLNERRRAADAARQQRLFEQAPGFITILNGPQHVFEFANAAYRKLFGDREYVGQSVRQAFPELADQDFFNLLDRVYDTGERFVASRTPVRFKSVGGELEERFLDFIYEPVTNETGTVTGIFVEGYDVTQAHSAEQALRESEARLRALVEAAPIGLVFADASGRITGANTGIEEILGRPITHSISPDDYRDDYVAFHADGTQVEAHEYPLARVLDGGVERAELEVQVQRPDMSLNWVRYIATPIRDEQGNLTGAVVASLDIEQEKRFADNLARAVDTAVAERGEAVAQIHQLQKMETVGQLTGGLAHDFNNILAGINGSLEMMRTRLTQGRVSDIDRYLTGAAGAVRKAANLTQRLLAFSRRQTLDPKAIDLNALTNGMLDLITRSVGPEIAVETIGASGLWPTFADPGQLENALLNLSVNARDAMPHGGKLTIETSNRWMDDRAARQHGLSPGQYVSLCVSDTGTGMTPDVIAKAFDPFYTTKPIGQGTGLGLSMVYGFAGQSGGTVKIYSELGKGTMVCIYLPRHHGLVASEHLEAMPSHLPRSKTDMRILLVDDEPLIRMVAAEQLEELGYEVTEAGDASEAIKIMQRDPSFSLLVTDVGLPNGMNGRQLAEAAREHSAELPVLFITGYAENAVLNHGHLDHGMQVLTKPFTSEALAQKVDELASQGRNVTSNLP